MELEKSSYIQYGGRIFDYQLTSSLSVWQDFIMLKKTLKVLFYCALLLLIVNKVLICKKRRKACNGAQT